MPRKLSELVSEIVEKIAKDREPIAVTKDGVHREGITKFEQMMRLVFGDEIELDNLIFLPRTCDYYVNVGNGFYISVGEDTATYKTTKDGQRVKQILTAYILILRRCKNCGRLFDVDIIERVSIGYKNYGLNLRLLAEAIAEHLDEELCPKCREKTLKN